MAGTEIASLLSRVGSAAAQVRACALASRRKRRILFPNMWDVMLLKAVISTDAHMAPHSEVQSRFEETLNLYVSSLPPGALRNVYIPSWKTLSDRFKKLLADHRISLAANAVASGIIKARRER